MPPRNNLAESFPARAASTPAKVQPSHGELLARVFERARQRHGVSLEALAKALGLRSKSHAWRLVNGRASLTGEHILTLAAHDDPRMAAVGLDVAGALLDATIGSPLFADPDPGAQVRQVDRLGFDAREAGRDVGACPTPAALRRYADASRALERAAGAIAAWAEAQGREDV